MAFPVEEKFIVRTESELGVCFPNSFKSKMSQDNGGEVLVGEDIYYLFPFYDDSDKKRIRKTCNSITRETLNERKHFRFPDNLIAIGNNGGGDLLVFKISEKGCLEEMVYWLNHENHDLEIVANSFGELREGI